MTGSATNEGALRELRRVGLEKQKAWDAVPSLKEVLEEAERARDAAATEDWLERAHEIMTGTAEDEKDWARDQNDDLFLVSRQAAARRRVPAPARPTGGGGSERQDTSSGRSEAELERSSVRWGGETATTDRLLAEASSVRVSEATPRTHQTMRSVDYDADGIQQPSPQDLVTMRKEVGNYSRSTIVSVVNRTDSALRLSKQDLRKGQWCTGHAPPRVIPARSEVRFASGSEKLGVGALAVPVGGTEGSVEYESAPEMEGSRAGVWTFRLVWSNPFIVTDPRGRYVEQAAIPPETTAIHAGRYTIISDGTDQDSNGEVSFVIASHDDERAARDIGVESGLHLKPGEVIHSGLLEKCNAKGIEWQRRLFMLTHMELLYVENKRSTKAKRKLPLARMVKVTSDEFQPNEFAVIMQEGGDQGSVRSYELRSATAAEATEWVLRISAALQLAESAISITVENTIGKRDVFQCQVRSTSSTCAICVPDLATWSLLAAH